MAPTTVQTAMENWSHFPCQISKCPACAASHIRFCCTGTSSMIEVYLKHWPLAPNTNGKKSSISLKKGGGHVQHDTKFPTVSGWWPPLLPVPPALPWQDKPMHLCTAGAGSYWVWMRSKKLHMWHLCFVIKKERKASPSQWVSEAEQEVWAEFTWAYIDSPLCLRLGLAWSLWEVLGGIWHYFNVNNIEWSSKSSSAYKVKIMSHYACLNCHNNELLYMYTLTIYIVVLCHTSDCRCWASGCRPFGGRDAGIFPHGRWSLLMLSNQLRAVEGWLGAVLGLCHCHGNERN